MRIPEPAEDVVVIVGQVGERHRHADAGVECQIRRRYPVEVDATGRAIETVIRQDAVFILTVQRCVVAVVLAAATTAPVHTHHLACAERILAQQRVVTHQRVHRLSEAEYAVGVGDLRGGAPPIIRARREVPVDGVVVEVDALRELSRPRAAAFGDDLNHAGRRIRAIQRRGRGALYQLDRLDVPRLEVVQALIGLAAIDGQRMQPVLEKRELVDLLRNLHGQFAGRAENEHLG